MDRGTLGIVVSNESGLTPEGRSLTASLPAGLGSSPDVMGAEVFIAVSNWSGSRPLAPATLSMLDPHRDSTQLSCCCPGSWRSCSLGSTGSTSLHTPAARRWRRG